MLRIDKLFLEDKLNPQDNNFPPLEEILAQPMNSEVPKAKKKKACGVWNVVSIQRSQQPRTQKRRRRGVL